ncbi:HLA class I histocompatibility antigen, C alpha chain-like [Hoplias malabaricus]|uniref:HLA class I histocompatibility antigen, C alpha chain-like n=1 Tax=Hoplias malabaricus TaxID=27720 RepID=UPI00346320E6
MELYGTLLVLCCFCACASAAVYIHRTLYTMCRGLCYPEYRAVSFINQLQITEYNSTSRTLNAVQPWVREVLSPLYWKTYEELHSSEYTRLSAQLNAAMKSLGHFSGVHTLQHMSGCIWNDEDGDSKDFDIYRYDRQNFICLDMNKMKYITYIPKAKDIVEWLNSNMSQSCGPTNECVMWLRRFGKETLMRTGTKSGNISSFQRNNSVADCHIGFSPRLQESMKEGMFMRAIFPDPDISEYQNEWNISKLTCGLENKSMNATMAPKPLNTYTDHYIVCIAVPVTCVGLALFAIFCYCIKQQSVNDEAAAADPLTAIELDTMTSQTGPL